MCGRYSLAFQAQKLAEKFGVKVSDSFVSRYNACPTQKLPVITDKSPLEVQDFSWGLIPSWSKDKTIASKLINARSETITEKPSFRNAFKSRRCIIPTDGYYEWKTTEEGKTPYRITLKDNDIFVFAGIWETWKSPESDIINTFSLITTEANEKLSQIHSRMPIILPVENIKKWLDPKTKVDELIALLVQYPSEEFNFYKVSKKINYPANDSPELIQEVA